MNGMKLCLLFAAAILAAPALAALKPGDAAPDFTAQAAAGGKEFTFTLAESLKHGPVVLYFYPKSFTRGCTIEAHEFAEAEADFEAAGATLIGMSKDTIDTQRKFSTEECRDKFPVAADPDASIIRTYDALRAAPNAAGEFYADRISYVIGTDGRIIYAYTDSKPDKHIENTLEIVKELQKKNANPR